MRRAPAVILLLAIAAVGLLAVLAIQHIEKPGSPIGVPTVSKAFSPNADGIQDSAKLTIHTKHRDTVSIWIVDAAGKRVTEVVRNRRVAGTLTAYWNGTGASDRQGAYRMQVRSARTHRTITVPSPINLDLTSPRASGASFDLSRYTTMLRVIRSSVRLADPADVALAQLQYQSPTGAWTAIPTVRIVREQQTWNIAGKLPAAGGSVDQPLPVRLEVLDHAGNPTDAGQHIAQATGR